MVLVVCRKFSERMKVEDCKGIFVEGMICKACVLKMYRNLQHNPRELNHSRYNRGIRNAGPSNFRFLNVIYGLFLPVLHLC